MKPVDFIVRIPEPCHEDWSKMQPDAKGKFCKSCCHSVYDFSEKTPAEIRDVLLQHSSRKVCGYFKETQLNRPLTATPGHRFIAVTKRFAIAVYLVFGSLLFSCKIMPEPEQKSSGDWKQDAPVFQKGRFTTNEPDTDSTRQVYGKADYRIYVPEEITDSVIRLPE